MHVSKLTLTNYRNHEKTVLELRPGLSVFQGANGQGKSNLLEAVYLLAIARSPRTNTDRELVNWDVARSGGHAQVAAVARAGAVTAQVQVDFELGSLDSPIPAGTGEEAPPPSLRKSLRVNGIQRTAADFVGALNVVFFEAEDLDLVLGAPAGRRRYLDILISQSDPAYLKTLQRYQRVLAQRNQLLRRLRDGRAADEEMLFWDDRLSFEGAAIIERRHRAVVALARRSAPIHLALSGGREELSMVYRPRIGTEEYVGKKGQPVPESQGFQAPAIARALAEVLIAIRQREVAQGVTVVGPHRDDLDIILDGQLAASFASRGQGRCIALAMKLAEAGFVHDATGRTPVLALDDVLSELDSERRKLVLEAVSGYDQVLLTTTDLSFVDEGFLKDAVRYQVQAGAVSAAG